MLCSCISDPPSLCLFSSNGYVFGRINLKLRTSAIHTIPFSFTSIKLICWNATMYETKNLLRLSRLWQSGHCWVLFLKTNVWSHKQVRLSWQHFPHQSVLTRLHTVVSKEKPRKGHLWTLLTRRRQVSSPAPATMIFFNTGFIVIAIKHINHFDALTICQN